MDGFQGISDWNVSLYMPSTLTIAVPNLAVWGTINRRPYHVGKLINPRQFFRPTKNGSLQREN